ncbi:MAG: hypothetical protein ACFB6R_10985 [Alphaproteobacteria bacterium]
MVLGHDSLASPAPPHTPALRGQWTVSGQALEPSRQWYRLGAVSPLELKNARLQAHYAVQWLARTARAVVPPRRDDSHMALIWDHEVNGLVTQPMLVRDGPVRLALSFTAGGIALLGPGGAEGLLPLDAVTEGDVRDFLMAWAGRFEIDPADLLQPMPYAMPRHPLAEGGCYGFSLDGEAVRELGRWFFNGFDALDNLAGRYGGRATTPIRVRVWPHHFDIGMLITLGEGGPAGAPVVGVGLSPGDDLFREPYFYVTPFPSPGYGSTLPAVAAPAGWHTDRSYTGVVLRGGDAVRSPHPRGLVDAVLAPAIEGCIALVQS